MAMTWNVKMRGGQSSAKGINIIPGMYPQIVSRRLSQKSFPIPNLAATATVGVIEQI